MCHLLNSVERYLGSFDEWPAEILRILFIQLPSRRMLRKLLAFFYGNGTPCPLASQLYHACNNHSTSEEADIIYRTYEDWDKTQFARHMSKYYNLRHKKYVYLNGKRRGQNQMVPNITNPIPLGIYNTGFSFLVLCQNAFGLRMCSTYERLIGHLFNRHTLLDCTCF
jgi:hypothetical protein